MGQTLISYFKPSRCERGGVIKNIWRVRVMLCIVEAGNLSSSGDIESSIPRQDLGTSVEGCGTIAFRGLIDRLQSTPLICNP